MHNSAKKYPRVSDLQAFLLCPRLAYFRMREETGQPSKEILRSAVMREISLSMYSVASAKDRQATLERLYVTACEDIAMAYGQAAEEVRAAGGLRPENILGGMERETARLGRERLLALLRSEDTLVSLRSDRLHLSGTVDRIACADSKLMPAVVSSSQPPENGIYRSDRIRLAAYALLMSERYGCEVNQGIVEYMGGWCIREAEVRRGDKREALSIRRRIEETSSAMPDCRRGKWCEKCAYQSNCTARVSFLDSLFRRPDGMDGMARGPYGTDK